MLIFVSSNIMATELPEWTKTAGSRTKPSFKLEADVSKYGAVGDGQTVCTKQIQAAIDDKTKKKGGRVVFPAGEYLTGALFVKSNVELHIAKGVTLRAVNNTDDFPDIQTRVAGVEMVWPAAIINVSGQRNVSITGEGVIDGDGKYLWDRYWEMRRDYDARGLRWIVDYDCKRVRSLLISNSEDVTVSGLTFLRAGFWTVQALYSTHCTFSGITIRNNIGGHGPSTDGIDVDSSTHILIEGCDVDCNDDNICLKAGRDADGLRVNRPTEYVLIRNCTARRGAGLMTCGSETSGCIRHIYCIDSRAAGTSAALRIKSAINRGGTVEDIHMINVSADSTGYILNCDMNWNPSYSYSTLPAEYEGKELPPHWKAMLAPVSPERGMPTFGNINLSNITGKNVRTFINCSGNEKSLIDGVTLTNINVEAGKSGEVKYTRNFSMDNVELKTADGSEISVGNSQ
jgi:polygalacturonase